MKNIKISVYGSAAGNSVGRNVNKAREIGKEIAKNKCVVVTGACKGLPQKAAASAKEFGGKTVGFSGYTSLSEHKKNKDPVSDKMIFIRKDYKYKNNLVISRKYRNVSSVAYCDAAVFIGGRTGTLNEFTIAYDLGKIMGILKGSGGVCDSIMPKIIKTTDKRTAGKLIFEKDPKKLVEKIIREVTK